MSAVEDFYHVGFPVLPPYVLKKSVEVQCYFDMSDTILFKFLEKKRVVSLPSLMKWHFCRALNSINKDYSLPAI